MAKDRNEIYGRIIAIATVLGDRVFDKDTPQIAGLHLERMGKQPAKTVALINHQLMEHSHKFGLTEMTLFDLMGEQIAKLDIEDFTNAPLDDIYLRHYYGQKAQLVVGVAEAAEILGWKKQQVYEYRKRGVFPEPVQTLASGPIWDRSQIEAYRDARVNKPQAVDSE